MTAIETAPPPTDALGKADNYQVHQLVDDLLDGGASVARITAIAWRRPASAAQVVLELIDRVRDAHVSVKELGKVQRERDSLQRKLVQQQQVLDVQARRLRGAA